MRKATLLPLLFIVFFSTTGASIIDRETKKSVLGLDEKFERLAKQAESRHGDEMRLLKEQRELIQRLNQRIEALEKQVRQASQAVKSLEAQQPAAATAAPTPLPALLPQPTVQPPAQAPAVAPAPQAAVQSTQPVSPPPPPVAPQPVVQPTPIVSAAPVTPAVAAPAAVQPLPSQPPSPAPVVVPAPQAVPSPPPVVKPVVKTLPPPAVAKVPATTAKKKSGGMEPMTVFAFLLSGICVLLVVGLIVRLRKGEERFKKILWKSEMESLREEVVRGRPLLKILTEGDRVDLINAGETTADEIKVYIGPAPAAMKQKVKTVLKLQAGERIELELQAQLSQDPLYSTLEYKNPNTGRIYKEQFVLKIDRLTGNPIPIQQAS